MIRRVPQQLDPDNLGDLDGDRSSGQRPSRRQQPGRVPGPPSEPAGDPRLRRAAGRSLIELARFSIRQQREPAARWRRRSAHVRGRAAPQPACSTRRDRHATAPVGLGRRLTRAPPAPAARLRQRSVGAGPLPTWADRRDQSTPAVAEVGGWRRRRWLDGGGVGVSTTTTAGGLLASAPPAAVRKGSPSP